MKIHESVTGERVERLVRESIFGLSDPGICLNCGEDADGCEPDAREYKCERCGENKVFGSEEILLMGAYH